MKVLLLFHCLLVFVSPVLSFNREWKKHTVLNGSEAKFDLKWIPFFHDSLALCNDGSQAAFHFSPFLSEEFKDTYLVYLPGGGQCWDEISCLDRWNNVGSTYMTSKSYTQTTFRSGLFDINPEKSPFWGANKILLGYCSSDGYMGDNEAWGWHFRGQRIVFSLIDELITSYGLSSNSTIIMSGGSAGARGVMTLLDRLVEERFPKGSKVIGFLDSPYYLDIVPYSSNFVGFPYEEQSKYLYFNTSGVIYGDCASQYNTGSQEDKEAKEAENLSWKCQFGEYRIPYVRTPYLMVASQYDSYQLSNNLQTQYPKSSKEIDYCNDFAKKTQGLVIDLANQQPSGEDEDEDEEGEGDGIKYGYLSWSCYNHDVSENEGFFETTTSEGISQNLALKQYLGTNPYLIVGNQRQRKSSWRKSKFMEISTNRVRGKSSGSMLWIDECIGFSCGTGC
jgi:hypothetical protein